MKKLLSLVLALMMLMVCPVMAETATQTIVSPNGDYAFEVPQDYIPMDAEFMMGILSAPEMQQVMAQMMGLEDASQLELYFELIKASNMVIVYGANMMSNLNVQTAESTLTMDLMVLLKSTMDAAMIQQYATLGVAEEDIQLMDIQEIAGRRWYGIQLTMAGMPMQSMITVENGVQYTVTFTAIGEEDMQKILESFQIVNMAE